ncbi:MAG: RHS repeat protein [Treponema sp.]|nr:RHS repeat protein [Treponema sp.]MBR0101497.1 RHS repeat protein [Treponema sp.]
MNEIIDAINHNCSASGVAEIIKQILTFKRQFFLSMDKKTLNNKYSFTTNKEMRPLIFDNTPENVKRVPCVNVTLSERSAAYGSKNYNDFYSAISRKDLLRLCKLSEVDENFTILFAFCGTEIPVKAKELVPILSEFSFLKAVKNFYKLKIVKASFLIDAVFLIIIFSAFYTGKIEPAQKAKKEAQQLEQRRFRALASGNREVLEYSENGNLILEFLENGKFHEYKYYDEKGRLIRIESESGKEFLDYYGKDGVYKRETSIKSERSFEYNKNGALRLEKGKKTQIFYNYDDNFKPKGETFEDTLDEIRYDYDSNGRKINTLKKIRISGNMAFDENGNALDYDSSTSSTAWYEYDEEGKLLREKIREGDSEEIFETTYKYDENGNLVFVAHADGGSDLYRYDSQGRLYLNEKRKKASDYYSSASTYYTYNKNGTLKKLDISYHHSGKDSWIYIYNDDDCKIYEKMDKTDVDRLDYNKFHKHRLYESWFMYDFYYNGNIKRITRYFL